MVLPANDFLLVQKTKENLEPMPYTDTEETGKRRTGA